MIGLDRILHIDVLGVMILYLACCDIALVRPGKLVQRQDAI